jgi:HEAT repeat protein
VTGTLLEHIRVRRSAVNALGRIGVDRAVEPLIKALSDEWSEVRRDAAEALVLLYDNNKIGEKNKQVILANRGTIINTHKDYTPSSDCTDHLDVGVKQF